MSLTSTLMINLLAWLTLVGLPVIREHKPRIYHQDANYHIRYIVYGPLLNGVTTTVFESTPVYPTPSRYWQTVEKHKLTQFYSAPTAIRLLRRLGEHHVQNYDLSSLRVLGSVGEPINPEAWNWYNEHIGKTECAIVDTFWYVVRILDRCFTLLSNYPGKLRQDRLSSRLSLVLSKPNQALRLFLSSVLRPLSWTLSLGR